jgi:hypothetical protein
MKRWYVLALAAVVALSLGAWAQSVDIYVNAYGTGTHSVFEMLSTPNGYIYEDIWVDGYMDLYKDVFVDANGDFSEYKYFDGAGEVYFYESVGSSSPGWYIDESIYAQGIGAVTVEKYASVTGGGTSVFVDADVYGYFIDGYVGASQYAEAYWDGSWPWYVEQYMEVMIDTPSVFDYVQHVGTVYDGDAFGFTAGAWIAGESFWVDILIDDYAW